MTPTTQTAPAAGTGVATAILTVENHTEHDLQLRPHGKPYYNGAENTDYTFVAGNSPGLDRAKGALLRGKHLQLEVHFNDGLHLLVDHRPLQSGPWQENQAAHLHFERYGNAAQIYDFTGQYRSPIDSRLLIGGKEIPTGGRYPVDLSSGTPVAVSYVIGKRDHVPDPSQKMIAVSYQRVKTWSAGWSNRYNKEVNGAITTWRFTLQPEEFDIKNWKIMFEMPDGAFVEQTAANHTENGRQVTLSNKTGEILLKGHTRDVDVQIFSTKDPGNAGKLTDITKLRAEGWS
ncbi:hypothetical protein GCM10009678_62480 [Actinomadura kijaniata]|uniref:Uncharacterized protein n=1 Tax=Actinomadura namibiensis TaxID=182080 RepID=A0A7W3LXU8_ACTNM|nr:hypothetical protein [Actinomadura namibiensis]MBA8956344.1 hypothetical protein [Actinomadura namibiensis]